MFNNMKPFVLTAMMMTKYFGDQPASYEGTFVQMAAEQKKEILGLETVAEQMAVFDKISYETQAEELMEMLNDDKETEDLFSKMLEEYKEEDAEGLYDLIVESHDGTKEELGYMLSDRNKNWIPRMAELAKKKSVFFGVGAGHLAGEEGILSLLRAAGYTVTAI